MSQRKPQRVVSQGILQINGRFWLLRSNLGHLLLFSRKLLIVDGRQQETIA